MEFFLILFIYPLIQLALCLYGETRDTIKKGFIK